MDSCQGDVVERAQNGLRCVCSQKHGPVEINFQLKSCFGPVVFIQLKFVKIKSNHSSFQSFGPVEVKEKK